MCGELSGEPELSRTDWNNTKKRLKRLKVKQSLKELIPTPDRRRLFYKFEMPKMTDSDLINYVST